MVLRVAWLAGLLAMLLGAPAEAATFTVTTVAESGAGSFEQAILNANANAGADVIGFSIGSGAKALQGVFFSHLTEAVTVDGTTQPGYAGVPLIEFPDGVIDVDASNVTVTGIKALNLQVLTGSGVLVTGNVLAHAYTAAGTGTTIGGTTASVRNVITADLQADGTTIVQGNRIGLSPDGLAIGAGSSDAIQTNGTATIGGPTAAAGNVIGGQRGVVVSSGTASIQHNVIGLDVTGSRGLASGTGAVVNSGATAVIRDNVIGGMMVTGVQLSSNGSMVRGNRMGESVDGSRWLGNQYGVTIDGSENVVGGTGAGEGNEILASAFVAVWVYGGAGNTIVGNDLHDNGTLGIDLGVIQGASDGPDASDAGDIDAGANGRQNAPVLTAGSTGSGGAAHVTGTLGSAASHAYAIDVYASDHCDFKYDLGEGSRYVGRVNVGTGAGGNATIDGALTGTVSAGEVLTATATDSASKDTSEFSNCVPAGGKVIPAIPGAPAGTTNGGVVYSQRYVEPCDDAPCPPSYRFSLIFQAASGGRHVNLTHGQEGGYADFGPVVSPDGNRVAFTRCPATCVANSREVWMVGIDGSNPHLVSANAKDPTWSPDGSTLAYVGAVDVDAYGHTLVTVSSDGAGVPSSVPGDPNCFVDHPHWLPGAPAKLLVRMSCGYQDPYPVPLSVVTVSSGARALEPYAWPEALPVEYDVSSDGRHLLVNAPHRLVVADRVTGKVTDLTGDLGAAPYGYQYGAWSPDGQKVVASGPAQALNGRGDLWVMTAGGTSPVGFTADLPDEVGGDWQPCVTGVTVTCTPPPLVGLTVVRAGSGSGSVSGADGGISCPPTCSAQREPGSVATLYASSDVGSVFSGWSGACSGTDACVVTMSQARSVTATFAPEPVETITPEPGETATPDPGGTATPGPGGAVTPQPGKPTPTATPDPAATTVLGASAFAPVSSRTCLSKRRFSVHVKKRAGATLKSAKVTIAGRTQATKVKGTAIVIDLRRLPKGRVTVKVSARFTDGARAKLTRRYRTCASRR
jgi:hypothetical protein